MKVILKENVDGVGYLGDLLSVADGYARNFLLPRGKAVLANPRNLKTLEHLKRVASHQVKKEVEVFQELGEKISGVSLTFHVQTGKDDKLFGSVTSKDVADGLAEQGVEVDRRKIQLGQPIKELGKFSVPIKLHRDVVPEVSVTVMKKETEEKTDAVKAEPVANPSEQASEEVE